MSFGNPPKTGFGRRERSVSPIGPSSNRKTRSASTLNARIALAVGALGLLLAVSLVALRALPDLETLDANAAKAEQRVSEIVNQPVKHLSRTAEAAVFSPGWFHVGAITPDFDNADVRATQELLYARYPYVTSDVTPSEMFVGGELEFNAMTKYFYADRTLPKKRLSEPEMLEINSLYRIIGSDRQAHVRRWETLAGLMLTALGVCLGAAMLLRTRRS